MDAPESEAVPENAPVVKPLLLSVARIVSLTKRLAEKGLLTPARLNRTSSVTIQFAAGDVCVSATGDVCVSATGEVCASAGSTTASTIGFRHFE